MSNIKTFRISDEFFQGFTVELDLDYYESIDAIAAQAKRTLITLLEQHQLELLVKKAQEQDFHIHDYEIGDILLADSDTVFWICSHC